MAIAAVEQTGAFRPHLAPRFVLFTSIFMFWFSAQPFHSNQEVLSRRALKNPFHTINPDQAVDKQTQAGLCLESTLQITAGYTQYGMCAHVCLLTASGPLTATVRRPHALDVKLSPSLVTPRQMRRGISRQEAAAGSCRAQARPRRRPCGGATGCSWPW